MMNLWWSKPKRLYHHHHHHHQQQQQQQQQQMTGGLIKFNSQRVLLAFLLFVSCFYTWILRNYTTLNHHHREESSSSSNGLEPYSFSSLSAAVGSKVIISSTTTTTITNKQQQQQQQQYTHLGCFVLLAPQRTMDTWWNDITRFCLLMRAVRSIDQHVNAHYGPYPIIILVAKDWHLDPKQRDGEYTASDRALIQSWAPVSNNNNNHSSMVIFQEINMYSKDALEPNTNRELILKWREGGDGSVPGRDLGYTSMCRLWSGRLQNMEFMQQYKYYMRMDDDSLLIETVPEDPFLRMERDQLTYMWMRDAVDLWGIHQLWNISRPHLTLRTDTPFVDTTMGYNGAQPYNNFHISLVAFWTSPEWMAIWNDLNHEHAFFKYRVGDANVHAIAIMTLQKNQFQRWREIPYRHNTNDMGVAWAPKEWRLECEDAQNTHNISWAKNH